MTTPCEESAPRHSSSATFFLNTLTLLCVTHSSYSLSELLVVSSCVRCIKNTTLLMMVAETTTSIDCLCFCSPSQLHS